MRTRLIAIPLVVLVASCAPMLEEQTAPATQTTAVPLLDETEILFIYDNDFDAEVWGWTDNGSGVLVNRLVARGQPWRWGFVSTYADADGAPPSFLGNGFTRHTEENVNDTLKPALRDVRYDVQQQPTPFDRLVQFLDTPDFRAFHRPNAHLHIAVMAARDDASLASVADVENALDTLDVETSVYVILPENREGCYAYPPAPRLSELADHPMTVWSYGLCPSFFGWMSVDGIMTTPPGRANQAAFTLDHLPIDGTLQAQARTDGAWRDLPEEQVVWDGDLDVLVTGPLDGADEVRLSYPYDVPQEAE